MLAAPRAATGAGGLDATAVLTAADTAEAADLPTGDPKYCKCMGVPTIKLEPGRGQQSSTA